MKSFKQHLQENEHIKFYSTAGVGYELNRKLQSGEPLSNQEKYHHKGLTDYIKNNKVSKSMTVFRGQGVDPGPSMSTKGYLSTSDNIGSAMAYAENHLGLSGEGHVLHIDIKPHHAVSNIDKHSLYSGEGEHLIHHGSTVKFHSKQFDKEDNLWHHYGNLVKDGT